MIDEHSEEFFGLIALNEREFTCSCNDIVRSSANEDLLIEE